MTDEKQPVKSYGISIPIYVSADDKDAETRRFLKGVGENIARMIMGTWQSDRANYLVDITISMTEGERL